MDTLYINIIAANTPDGISVTLYADDIAVIAQNKYHHVAKTNLQGAVNTIRLNLEKLGLQLTAEKTKLLSFGKTPHRSAHTVLNIGSHSIESSPVVKYLGLMIDHKLKFKEHVQIIQIHCNKLLNIIKFLRGTWWGCDPQTLITIYKALIRSKIEYGSIWYFPQDNKSRTMLERIQIEALKLAMGYRRSTPTNVILAETKLPSLKDRTSYLGAKYLLKVIINGSNPFVSILADFCEAYSRQHNSLNPAMDNDRPLVRSINLVEEYTPLLDRLPNLLINTTDYTAQLVQLKIESEFITKWRNTAHSSEVFQDIIQNKYHSQRFTPEDNHTTRITLPKQASVFTAECVALEAAFKYIYRHQDNAYVVSTDSLSLVQTMDSPGIQGNEQVDRESKEAAQSAVNVVHTVPHTDIFPLLKQKITKNTHKKLTRQASFKGGAYFNKYYSDSSTHPCFHNKKLPRHTTVWINRLRSNHYNLKASLKRVNIVQDTRCQCGFPVEDIDHMLWDCTRTQAHRQEMVQQLGAKRLTPPYKIEKFLKSPNITALKIIDDFLYKNNLNL
ncbi:hypothetical protein ANTQUA_LOCUS3443 [Anthophora quadrimaculata]